MVYKAMIDANFSSSQEIAKRYEMLAEYEKYSDLYVSIKEENPKLHKLLMEIKQELGVTWSKTLEGRIGSLIMKSYENIPNIDSSKSCVTSRIDSETKR